MAAVGGARPDYPAGLRGRVTVKEASAEGAVDAAAPPRVARRGVPRLRQCYEHGLRRDPALKGLLELEWLVSPAGKVLRVSVARSTVGSRDVETCARAWAMSMSFSPTGDGKVATVRATWVLEPER